MTATVRRLLAWYGDHQRDLPWRNTSDAYRIFMSELMLQQTQVDRVIPLWRGWLKRFPTWKSLAQAQTPDLIRAWAGLGYNRRALFARAAAQMVVSEGVPADEDGWRRLKGVGPYMAAALTEFVNHRRALVIDTNVRRVIGRVFLGVPFPKPSSDPSILTILEHETPRSGAHWDMPQALMDLASTICSSRRPSCDICPLRATCQSRSVFASNPNLKPARQANREHIQEGKAYPDRIYRGRILAWVREHGATDIRHVGAKIDQDYSPRDQVWVEKMIERMIKDGFLEMRGKKLRLKGGS